MRQRFYSFETKPFHLAYRSSEKCKFKQMQCVWNYLLAAVESCSRQQGMKTHALVLMGNHFHWLWSPSEEDSARETLEYLSTFLNMNFNGETIDWERHIFPVKTFFQYHEVYKYIYRNPVEAGIVMRVENYTWSTLQHVLGKKGIVHGLHDPFGLIFDQFRMLKWLNTPQNTSQNEANMIVRNLNSC